MLFAEKIPLVPFDSLQWVQEARNLTLLAQPWALEAKGGSVCDSLYLMVTFGTSLVLEPRLCCSSDVCVDLSSSIWFMCGPLIYKIYVNFYVLYANQQWCMCELVCEPVWIYVNLNVYGICRCWLLHLFVYMNYVNEYGVKLQGKFCPNFELFVLKL